MEVQFIFNLQACWSLLQKKLCFYLWTLVLHKSICRSFNYAWNTLIQNMPFKNREIQRGFEMSKYTCVLLRNHDSYTRDEFQTWRKQNTLIFGLLWILKILYHANFTKNFNQKCNQCNLGTRQEWIPCKKFGFYHNIFLEYLIRQSEYTLMLIRLTFVDNWSSYNYFQFCFHFKLKGDKKKLGTE